MESLLYIFLFWIGWLVLSSILKSVGRGVKKVVTGKDTYFGPAEIKLIDDKLDDSDHVIKSIMFRGRIPISKPMQVAFSISAFDITDSENPRLIIALLDQQQEPDTICFGIFNELGDINEGDSFTDWVRLGIVFPELLQTPNSGNRKIKLQIQLFNKANPPSIKCGFSDGGEVIFYELLEFEHSFNEKGYEEAAQDREEAQALSLKIGVAVAMADGELDNSEGEILKNWILKEISAFSEEKSNRLKNLFNDALKEGFALAQSGNLSLSPLVERLSEIGEKKTKYDAIELAFDVMAADGVADPEEMAVIRNVAKALDLDMEEIEKMRENVTLELSTNLTSDEGLESLVGIEDNWSDDQKKKHLRSEFQKWSNRLNSLPEGEERESAQSMLDNIASLRKKYG